jgi:hypothetical protein
MCALLCCRILRGSSTPGPVRQALHVSALPRPRGRRRASRAKTPRTLPSSHRPPPQRVYKEWQKQCLTTCDDDVRVYWICRQEEGLMAPFRCGPQNAAMNTCLNTCTTDPVKFGVYRDKRMAEIEAAALAFTPSSK